MKKFTTALSILGIFTSVLLTACDKAPEESIIPGLFHSETQNFSITFPADWEIKEGFYGTEVMAISQLENDSDIFAENSSVAIENLNEPITLDEYYVLGTGYLPGMVENYKTIEEGESQIDGVPSKYIIYSQTMSEIEAYIITHIALKDDKAYLINFATLPEKLETFRPTFNVIKDTFKFE